MGIVSTMKSREVIRRLEADGWYLAAGRMEQVNLKVRPPAEELCVSHWHYTQMTARATA